jgi:hypothetical protein
VGVRKLKKNVVNRNLIFDPPVRVYNDSFLERMGGGNGAKAAQKRERNAEKNKKAAGSQLKANEAAKTIKCELCKQSFLGTMRKPALTTHAEVNHTKAIVHSG